MFLGLAAGLAMLSGTPIAMAAGAWAGALEGDTAPVAPDGRPLEAAPANDEERTPRPGELDLSGTLTAPLDSDTPPEIVLRLRDAPPGEAGAVSYAGTGDNPLGAHGPWKPYVGVGESLGDTPYQAAPPSVTRLSSGEAPPTDEGYAGVDLAVSPLTSLSFRYRALAPGDDPEIRPTNTDDFTHNLEVGLQFGF